MSGKEGTKSYVAKATILPPIEVLEPKPRSVVPPKPLLRWKDLDSPVRGRWLKYHLSIWDKPSLLGFPMWVSKVSGVTTEKLYDGPALQPGKTYYLGIVLTGKRPADKTFGNVIAMAESIIPFTIGEGVTQAPEKIQPAKSLHPTVQKFVNGLKQPDIGLRGNAAFELSLIGDKAAEPALLEALQDPANARIMRNIFGALEKCGGDETVKILTKILESPSDSRKRESIKALGRLKHPDSIKVIEKSLSDPDPQIRQTAAYALGQIGDAKAFDSLISALKDEDKNVVKYAIEALGEIKSRAAVPIITDFLKEGRGVNKIIVIRALEKIGDRTAMPAVAERLSDQNSEVRKEAAETLNFMRDRDALPYFYKALLKETDKYAYRQMYSTMTILEWVYKRRRLDSYFDYSKSSTYKRWSKRAGFSDIPTLLSMLGDEDVNKREEAFVKLLSLVNASNIPSLKDKLLKGNSYSRRSIVYILGEMGGHEPLEIVAASLNDSEEKVRKEAVAALRKNTWGGKRDNLSSTIRIKMEPQTEEFLNKTWDELEANSPIKYLLVELDKAKSPVKKDSIKRLRWLMNLSTMPYFVELLNKEDPEIRIGVLIALGDYGNPNYIKEYFGKVVNDINVNVRRTAIQVLYFIRSRELIPLINEFCKDSDPEIKKQAEKVLEIYSKL
jgi:HEAT repeat protein